MKRLKRLNPQLLSYEAAILSKAKFRRDEAINLIKSYV
jgi:hypothetical protein